MQRYYHVDRRGESTEGQIAKLEKNADYLTNAPLDLKPNLKEHAAMLSPKGLSSHGRRFFLNWLDPTVIQANALQYLHSIGADAVTTNAVSCTIEMIWEYVRHGYFPKRPSRLQSMFAWESLDAAKAFLRRNNGVGTIYEVECVRWPLQRHGKPFRADMSLLQMSWNTPLLTSLRAHQYWAGESGENPQWEIVLPLPVRIVRRVG